MKNSLAILRKKYLFIGMIRGKREWRFIEYFDPSWSKRIREMAKYIRPGRSIIDLGCGKMWLRKYLLDNAYYPVDYKSRGKGTIVCDFNQKQFPQHKADVAFLSGTIEYIKDTNWFLSCIARNCNECIISYCLLEEYPNLAFRRKQAWVNDYSRDEIIRMFSEAGFQLDAESHAIPKNRIFHFIKTTPSFS